MRGLEGGRAARSAQARATALRSSSSRSADFGCARSCAMKLWMPGEEAVELVERPRKSLDGRRVATSVRSRETSTPVPMNIS